ncbi:MAG: gliding motility-associated C-terminal domain-containing protein [Flavobacteriales bacterium]|nr:gliding motility-associated C-terminal domain-containing protein [Flavobacteriales bacterium]
MHVRTYLSGTRKLLLAGLFVPLFAMAQVPTKCLEIERILVDACNPIDLCPGSTEGQNEMVRFRVGPSPIALNDIVVQWPNNTWRGFTQSTLTAQLTATLNATISGCGLLIEPPGGVIPAGAKVLLVTSTAMCTAANSFASLNDTLYITYQTAGNSNGHFANHNNGIDVVPAPVGGESLRTLIITRQSTACSDTATYDRQQLLNTYGTYGGNASENDGSSALFSWPGVPVVSYVNNGCLAPFEPLEVSASSLSGSLCDGGVAVLQGATTGAVVNVQWQGGTGNFSDPGSLSTTYTAGPGDVGTVLLTFCASGACGTPVCTDLELSVGQTPLLQISGNTAPCTGTSTTLTASGADSFLWNTGATDATIGVTQSGTYSVSASNTCGTSTASVEVLFSNAPVISISGTQYLCPVAEFTVSGADSYLWSTGSTSAQVSFDAPGSYSVVATNACGSITEVVEVLPSPVTAVFQASTLQGVAPLSVVFTNQSQPATASTFWSFGDGVSSSAFSPEYQFMQPGVYDVLLTASMDGCNATATTTITVLAEEVGEVGIRVPNVFSPNGDGVNDVLELFTNGITSLDMTIYNRWGQLIARLERVNQVWDGRTLAGERVPEGTYYYELNAVGVNGQRYPLRGSITLLR